MPKQAQRADVNNFIAGLITEASPLNFPPNASADEINFELNRDGSRKRRLGMDFESDRLLIETDLLSANVGFAQFNNFTWDAVNGNPDQSIIAVQVNQKLYMFDLNQASISGDGFLGIVILDQLPPTTQYAFASAEGYLVVVGGGDQVAVVSYVNSNFFVDWQRLLTRDLWGVEELGNPLFETDPSYRGPQDGYHYYNLQNQSWGIPRRSTAGSLIDPIFWFQTNIGSAPSNSEQVWTGMQFAPSAVGTAPSEVMYVNLYDESLGGSVSSAKGYFIIDALRRGQSRVEQFNANKTKYPQLLGNINIPGDLTEGGATCIAEFSGHIFYSGFNGTVVQGDRRSPNYDNYVFFSKLIKSKQDFNKCYQDGDPTSRDSNDIVDTDGGFIRVSGAKKILSLINLQTSLVVVASNGIWNITGGTTDSGFSATNYKVGKISTFGGISSNSVVSEGARAYYWSADGIYAIGQNQYGDLQVESLTLKSIQTLYQEIPNESKANAVGEYDQINKKVRWVYKLGDYFTDQSVTYELIFDSAVGSFTRNKIQRANNSAVEVVGVFRAANFANTLVVDDVYASFDQVFSSTDSVVVSALASASSIQSLRYVTLVSDGNKVFVSFSYYRNSDFKDWVSVDGIGSDAKAYCLTGAITAGDSGVDKQVPYLIMHFNRTEVGVTSDLVPENQSSCMFRAQWNFANEIISNKWTPLREAYRYRQMRIVTGPSDDFDTGLPVVTSKNKLRGRGKAFALYFETAEGKDCQILGWNITLNANQIT